MRSATAKDRSEESRADLCGGRERQQRSSLLLQNVCYRIKAWIDVRQGTPHGAAKHLASFKRRAVRGECFHRPYLGCREFVADFEVATETDIPEQPLSMHLGSMLFEIAYSEVRGKASEELQFYRHIEKENGIDERRVISGKSQALMFPAEIKMGWLDVPEEYYRNLDQAEGRQWVS